MSLARPRAARGLAGAHAGAWSGAATYARADAQRADRGAAQRLRAHRARQGPVDAARGAACTRCATRWCRSSPCWASRCASLVSGAIITEAIFGWPGMGRLAVEAISGLDLPVVMGIVFVACAAVQLGNVLADVAVAALDPRVRERRSRPRRTRRLRATKKHGESDACVRREAGEHVGQEVDAQGLGARHALERQAALPRVRDGTGDRAVRRVQGRRHARALRARPTTSRRRRSVALTGTVKEHAQASRASTSSA